VARKKRTKGAVLTPTGRAQPGYDSFKLKARGGNIVPLPTQQSPLAASIQEKARAADGRPRLHANPKSRRGASVPTSHSRSRPNRTTPSPQCSSIEFQPAETNATALLFVPVVIDYSPSDAAVSAKNLAKTAGIQIRTLGLGTKYDITFQDNAPGKHTISQLVELAFVLSGAPFIALLRSEPTESDWLVNGIQSAMDNRSPLAVIGMGNSGVFRDASLILERSNFINNNTLDRSFWRLTQRCVLA